MLYRYGVPFLETAWHAPESGSIQVNVGRRRQENLPLGNDGDAAAFRVVRPASYAARYIVGDNLGQIRLHYADGSTQDYPLILGESVWWGLPFYQTQDPFPKRCAICAKHLQESLRLYPAAPVDDGNYVAVIAPKAAPLEQHRDYRLLEKKGSVAIAGITVETAPGMPGSREQRRFRPTNFAPEFQQVRRRKSRCGRDGTDEAESKQRLAELSAALYTTDAEYQAADCRARFRTGYSGPQVTFKGTV